jgi:hypothetical protein
LTRNVAAFSGAAIEMAFAKLKAALRAAAARTIPDLWQAIADALRLARMRQLSRRRRIRCNLSGKCLSHDFSRQRGEKESLGEGSSPLVSGEGRIGIMLTV